MKKPLIIIGTGGLAKEILQIAESINELEDRWDDIYFTSDQPTDVGKVLMGREIAVTDASLAQQFDRVDLVVGIGDPNLRRRVALRLKAQSPDFAFPNLIHPQALVPQRYVNLGEGNVVAAGCIFTCEIEVGNFNLFNLKCTIGHDCRIGSFNVLNPSVNISGGVTLADAILIGTGAQILQCLNIASNSIVGAGAVATKNVEEGTTVVGIPAKPLK